jgi:hypothetical protein
MCEGQGLIPPIRLTARYRSNGVAVIYNIARGHSYLREKGGGIHEFMKEQHRLDFWHLTFKA